MEFWKDFKTSIMRHHFWILMGWRDVQRRYMRSVLGPFWLVINAILTVSILGPLYSFLFKIPMADYLVYMITGVLTWQFISQMFNEIPVLYSNNSHFIIDVNLPFSAYHLQMLWRNLIIYANSLVVILVVMLIFGHVNLMALSLFPVGLLLIIINCFSISSLVAALGTRYRDIVPIITNLLQAAFFATPIIWKKDMLAEYAYLNYFNPFFHALEVLREPFLGVIPDLISYQFLTATAVISLLLNMLCYPHIRRRLAFWL